MTYKVLSCGTPLQGNAEAGKVIVEGKVQLPSINPGETGTARFELPDSFRKGDVLELEAFDREAIGADKGFPRRSQARSGKSQSLP